MEWFSLDFFLSLFSIIIIDLVLAGDNAIVIGMAARNLPKKQQKHAILWGTLGAIVIRSLATVFVVWLLKIPGLLLVGGILLIWIAYQLLVEKKQDHDSVESVTSIGAAIRTIIIADTVMSLDNVLAVAGAAHGNFILVVLGLLISVPIIIWGSRLFIKLADRFPLIIYLGGGVLAWTAAKMITDEKLLQSWMDEPLLKWGIIVLIVAGVLTLGTLKNRKTAATEDAA
ncbi:MAG: TerC family protein [Planifilum sp.]|jgi:YjbE family integral membrane protein